MVFNTVYTLFPLILNLYFMIDCRIYKKYEKTFSFIFDKMRYISYYLETVCEKGKLSHEIRWITVQKEEEKE